MKVFDAHSDILNDVVNKRMLSHDNILENYHIDKLKKGCVFGSIFSVWVEPEFSNNYRKRAFEILSAAAVEFNNTKDKVKLVTSFNDFVTAENENKIAVLLGLEGMASVDRDVELIYPLYQYGVREASLTWNEENALATGANGDPNKGLSQYGVQAIKIMEKLGILLDVSHLNEKSFWDVNNKVSKPYIASHSNVYSLCRHPRNLKDDQIRAIADSKGVIGINAWPDFVDSQNPTLDKLLSHIDYIVNLVGIDYIGLGFDFCDFLDSGTIDVLSENKKNLTELSNSSQIQNLINGLIKRGYFEDEITKIAYKNFMRVFKEILR